MKWGRKYKLSNPPKKSGEYFAFYNNSVKPFKRYYEISTDSWYPDKDAFKKEWEALFGENRQPHYRWAKILEE